MTHMAPEVMMEGRMSKAADVSPNRPISHMALVDGCES